jgi:hypothetical protein
MTDNAATPNLVLEHLRHIRATTDKTDAKVLELERHLIELRLQVAGLAREDAHIQAKLAEHEIRFERIEKRLELRDD